MSMSRGAAGSVSILSTSAAVAGA